MHTTRSGFTIVELLIVIVVIGVLAAISIVSYSGIQDRAANVTRITGAKEYQKIITSYIIQFGKYPQTIVNTATACLGDGYPDWNNNGTQGCFATDNVKTTSTTLNAELRKITPTLPVYNKTPVQNGAYQNLGIAYRGILVDGQSGRIGLFYWLQGENKDCVLSGVARGVASNDYTATTNINSGGNSSMTACVVVLPDPTEV